ncbi:DcrB-related protein [Pantoea ananatis]
MHMEAAQCLIISCVFTEGHITLPDHYQDRTVNVFTLPGENTPAFNISRDSMNDDETLSGYIDRQLTLMQKHLKGWKQTKRVPAVLGNNLLQGECVHASYLRDLQTGLPATGGI